MANGGLLAVTGTQLLATCAYHHSTPVVVVSGIYKLSPAFPSDKDLFYNPISPSSILPYDSDAVGDVAVISPYYDYVDPNFVSLFITNV
jgi:translation initiation factor eIF-2B subunit beta